MKTLFAIVTCTLACSCATVTDDGNAVALSALYWSAVDRDACGATYYLFHADTARALPAFLDVLDGLQGTEQEPLSCIPVHDSTETRMTMFHRAMIALEDEAEAFHTILLRWCTDPNEEISRAGIESAEDISSEPDNPRCREAAAVLKELTKTKSTEAEPEN
jgi:hypothetical protein